MCLGHACLSRPKAINDDIFNIINTILIEILNNFVKESMMSSLTIRSSLISTEIELRMKSIISVPSEKHKTKESKLANSNLVNGHSSFAAK